MLPPRRVPLSAAQYEEAVSLLAELLLEIAAKRRAAASGGAMGGASGGVIGSVTVLPRKRREGREAA